MCFLLFKTNITGKAELKINIRFCPIIFEEIDILWDTFET